MVDYVDHSEGVATSHGDLHALRGPGKRLRPDLSGHGNPDHPEESCSRQGPTPGVSPAGWCLRLPVPGARGSILNPG